MRNAALETNWNKISLGWSSKMTKTKIKTSKTKTKMKVRKLEY